VFLSRIESSWRSFLGGLVIAGATLLTATGSVSAHQPLFGWWSLRGGYDPEDYIRNSAVLPGYYPTVSKFDRANAGAYGGYGYVPQSLPPACSVAPQPDAAPPCAASSPAARGDRLVPGTAPTK
jgi:hypothetical protein